MSSTLKGVVDLMCQSLVKTCPSRLPSRVPALAWQLLSEYLNGFNSVRVDAPRYIPSSSTACIPERNKQSHPSCHGPTIWLITSRGHSLSSM